MFVFCTAIWRQAGMTAVDLEASIGGPVARLRQLVMGKGLTPSTRDGLRRLMEVAEADTSIEVDPEVDR